ncbi:MAG: group II intron reverse transcriptase domain-containing protein [Chlorobia bacterium]|nr:group II intron reverse transcriptase domain-containing protein [Fimbriimonadaceae bacterium]
MLGGFKVTLKDRIFDERNLLDSCKSIAKAMQRATHAVPYRSKKYFHDIQRLNHKPQEVSALVVLQFRESPKVQFRRFVRAIPKKPGGKPERPISLFSIEARVLLRATLNVLWPIIEPIIVPSIAFCTFRKQGLHSPRGVVMATTELRDARRNSEVYVFETDIEGFFDKIDRKKLLAILLDLVPDNSVDELLETILNTETDLDHQTMSEIAFDVESGVPQGSALSPLLACAYLSPFDISIQSKGWKMIRYVDDIVVICDDLSSCEEAGHVISEEAAKFNLTLKISKTRVVSPTESIEYLGHTLHSDGRLLPSPRRMKAFANGIYQRAGTLPKETDTRVASELSSYIHGFFASLSHCDFEDWHYKHAARTVRKALTSRGLSPNRLDQMILRSRKWHPSFAGELK